MASADAPMKGIATLLEAFAKLRVERPTLELVLVTKPVGGGRTEQLIDQLGLEGAVRFVARPDRSRAGRADGVGRAGLRPVAVRGLQPARPPS